MESFKVLSNLLEGKFIKGPGGVPIKSKAQQNRDLAREAAKAAKPAPIKPVKVPEDKDFIDGQVWQALLMVDCWGEIDRSDILESKVLPRLRRAYNADPIKFGDKFREALDQVKELGIYDKMFVYLDRAVKKLHGYAKGFNAWADDMEGRELNEDQFPTDKARQASSKLKHQVHKATVAADKEPKLKLGVIGLSIGQKQSTGDTSRVSEMFAQPTEMMSRTLKDKMNNSAEGKSKDAPPTSIKVKDLIRKIKISLLSAKDTESLLNELSTYKPGRSMTLKDIDQLAVIADMDVKKLRKVVGM